MKLIIVFLLYPVLCHFVGALPGICSLSPIKADKLSGYPQVIFTKSMSATNAQAPVVQSPMRSIFRWQ